MSEELEEWLENSNEVLSLRLGELLLALLSTYTPSHILKPLQLDLMFLRYFDSWPPLIH